MSPSSSRLASSQRPNSEAVPWSRARWPSAVSSTRASASAAEASQREVQGGPSGSHQARGRQDQAARGDRDRVGPDSRGLGDVWASHRAGAEGPEAADRLVRPPADQLVLGAVEPSGRSSRQITADSGSRPRSIARFESARVVKPVRAEDRRVFRGRAGHQSKATPALIADGGPEPFVLVEPGMDRDRPVARTNRPGRAGDRAPAGPAPARRPGGLEAPGAGVDDQMRLRSDHREGASLRAASIGSRIRTGTARRTPPAGPPIRLGRRPASSGPRRPRGAAPRASTRARANPTRRAARAKASRAGSQARWLASRETAQVLPGEQQGIAGRQAVAPFPSEGRAERAEAPVVGDRLGHVIAPPAGHPAAETEVEVLDPAGEIDRVVAAECQELRADRRPGPARRRR